MIAAKMPELAGAAANAALRVIEVDPQGEPRWASFVESHPHALIYHHPAWLAALQAEYGRKPLALACEDSDGHFHGVLPLMRTEGIPFRLAGSLAAPRLASLPRTPVAGPLAFDRPAVGALVKAAMERIDAHESSLLQLKVASRALDGVAAGLVRLPWRLTYVLRLDQPVGELRFGNAVRRHRIVWSVNKAVRGGVRIRPAESESDLRAWFALYSQTMQRHAAPPRPYRFFRAAWETLRPRGLMQLLLAERSHAGLPRLLAGSVYLMHGQTVSYAFTGWRRAEHWLHANDLIHWEAIHEARRQGFRYYDFGEVETGQSSLAHYKSKWGAEPRRLYRYYYPADETVSHAALTVGPTLKQLYRWAPLEVSVMLGEWLYRYL